MTTYLGSWTLPSGNSCEVRLTAKGLAVAWDRPPSKNWPRADVDHWRATTFPAIVRAAANATGLPTFGISV